MNALQLVPLCFFLWLSMHAATVLELGEGGPESWTTGLDYSTVLAMQNDTLVRSHGNFMHHVKQSYIPGISDQIIGTWNRMSQGVPDCLTTFHMNLNN